MRKLLIFLLAFFALPTAVNAFWGCQNKKKLSAEIEPQEKEMNLALNKHVIIAQKI